MKVFVAQLNVIIGDLSGNTAKIIASIEEAKRRGADLVLFPEMTICGYMPADLLYHNSFIESILEHLEKIISHSHGITVVVGLVRRHVGGGEHGLFNSAAIIENGKVLRFYDKMLLPTYDVFTEERYFDEGESLCVLTIKGERVGIIICEDIWQHVGLTGPVQYPCDPILMLKGENLDLLLNLSASPYQYQKPDVRVNVCAKAAKTLKAPVVLCCQVGGNDGLLFDGHSVFVDQEGNLCRLGKGFEEDAMLLDTKAKNAPLSPRYDDLHDLYFALVMGVKDYLGKQGLQKVCLGLSGGIDSALVACIAKDALGAENVVGVLMPSRFTSNASVADAEKLAKNLGIQTLQISIEEPFSKMLALLNPHFAGKPTDATEENLQARIRGMILMALSNKHGYIVLSSGNKSEIAMGYCTLYGDMCGGLGVLGDVNKTKVYELARFLNRKQELIPSRIITRAPSAELRENQLDLDSLPEYGIVDAVLAGYVEENLSIDEIVQKKGVPLEIVLDLIQKIHRSEYKRRQGPLTLRVTRKSFSVGRHYPIVQGWV